MPPVTRLPTSHIRMKSSTRTIMRQLPLWERVALRLSSQSPSRPNRNPSPGCKCCVRLSPGLFSRRCRGLNPRPFDPQRLEADVEHYPLVPLVPHRQVNRADSGRIGVAVVICADVSGDSLWPFCDHARVSWGINFRPRRDNAALVAGFQERQRTASGYPCGGLCQWIVNGVHTFREMLALTSPRRLPERKSHLEKAFGWLCLEKSSPQCWQMHHDRFGLGGHFDDHPRIGGTAGIGYLAQSPSGFLDEHAGIVVVTDG